MPLVRDVDTGVDDAPALVIGHVATTWPIVRCRWCCGHFPVDQVGGHKPHAAGCRELPRADPALAASTAHGARHGAALDVGTPRSQVRRR